MYMPVSLSDEGMDLQKKEWLLVGVPFSQDGYLITVRESDKSHKYIRRPLARRFGSDTWYYEGYYDGAGRFVEMRGAW